MKRITIFSILLILSFILNANVSVSFDVEKPINRNNEFSHRLSIHSVPGQPATPYIPIKILIPQGEDVISSEIEFSERSNIIENIVIDHARNYYPYSKPAIDFSQKEKNIYHQNKDFPEYDSKYLGTQFLNGYQIALFNIYPYKYNPAKRTLTWKNNFKINIRTKCDSELAEKQNRFLVKDDRTINKIENLVNNPSAIYSYHKSAFRDFRGLADADDPFQMVIITDAEREPYFAEFIDWKNAQGIVTGIFLTEDIYEEPEYNGDDDQDEIRNFIIDAYTTYSGTESPLEYVILGGDDEIIPIRGVWAAVDSIFAPGYEYHEVDTHLPCDLYYSALDGDWNANGNEFYGEPDDEPDLLPEIAISRISSETEEEFSHFFDKNYFYADQNTYTNDIVYMIGEDMDWTPQTWGGDYMDEIIPFIPEDFHIFTLYDRDGTNSQQAVIAAFNSGFAMVHHVGHCNSSYAFGITTGNVDSFTNTEFGYAYSQGCHTTAFDEGTSGESECIAEHLINNETGLFAFIGNTRYGWGQIGSTDGGSQAYQKSFVQALFDEDLRELGNAMNYSRYELVNEALTIQVMRWVHYELTILGDPSISVKDPNGTFPYIQPAEVFYDDFQGDGDGNINPGETIEITIELENLEDWADAENVTATISFTDETIQLINEQSSYGDIPAGSSVLNANDPFIIFIPETCDFGAYQYWLEVNAPSNSGVFNRTYEMSLTVNLFQANFPWFGDYTINSNPIIYDENNDGFDEILIIDSHANINLLNLNAEMVEGFPIENNENLSKSTAFADINNDGTPEIIFASRTGRIAAIDLYGNYLFSFEDCSMQILTPIVANITGNENPEIISFGIDRNVYCVDSSGELINGFPVELAMVSLIDMAAADLDDDGFYEIVVGTNDGNLYAIDGNGNFLNNFPVNLNSPICASPIILNNKNIVVGTNDNRLYIIDPEANILLSKELNGRMATSAIAADFDEDDELEIAFSTQNGYLYLIKQNGDDIPGFPVFIQDNITNPPLSADLNNDDLLDLIQFSANTNFYAFDRAGNELISVPVGLSGNTPASLEDIDNDGDFEIVCGVSTGVVIIDYKMQKGSKIPWSTYRGNLQRTGFYNDNILYTKIGENTVMDNKFYLKQNYPNPFHTATTISFFTAENTEDAEISIYNIKGQKIKKYSIFNPSKAGHGNQYSISWDGTDENNKPVSSGIYFYKMKAGKYTAVKKMVLMK